MKWAPTRLDQLCSLITDGKHGDCRDETDSGYYFISAKDVKDGKIQYDNARQITQADFAETHRRTDFSVGDVVITNSGTIGRVAIGNDEDLTPRTTFQKSVAVLKPIRERVCSRFLRYSLECRREQLVNTAGGAAQKNLLLGDLRRFPIPLPTINEQERISCVLSAYDELIENNRRRMALLEEAAQQLYREWFVRLRFPGHEHTRITNSVPAGWERRTLGQICASLEDGDWIESKDQGGEDFRLLQISNIGINEFVETGNFRYVTEQTFKRLNCREIVPTQILIARMPKPIGRAWLVTQMPWRMITAVDVAILTTNDDLADAYFLTHFLNSPNTLELCSQLAVGATRPRVTKKNLAALPLLRPSQNMQRNFRDIAEPINQQRALLYRQNEKLRAARDLLLPRLMNGDIAV